MKRRVGALVFPGFELLDLYGPLEMFGTLPDRFEIRIVAESAAPVAGRPGPRTAVDDLVADRADYAILLVPGGPGTEREVDNPVLLDWLRRASAGAEITASVCTGAALLARAGLLDGRHATTNKHAYAWVTAQGPKVHWVPKARWVEDGPFLTSAGVSAGIDMALAVIARLEGEEAADRVALLAEYDRHHDPGWDPFAAAHGLD